ncbi:MAG: hypothetical protein V9E85_03675 [Candidatus Nanopelagicales bacterium]
MTLRRHCILVVATVITVKVYRDNRAVAKRQAQFEPFYTPPAQIPSTPGTIIRTEPLGVDVPGGTGFRVLYSSVGQKGEPVAVSGMMFISNKPAPPGGTTRHWVGTWHSRSGAAMCAITLQERAGRY